MTNLDAAASTPAPDAAPPAALVEPTRPVGTGWIAAFATAWLGIWMAQLTQALATQVLPDAASRGKDLGIMNIASAVPQSIGPLLGAAAVVATGSLTLVFVLGARFAFAGALAVTRVRSVR